MTSYWLVLLDPWGLGREQLELDFETDEEAITTCFVADIQYPCELWRGSRLLGIFSSSDRADADKLV